MTHPTLADTPPPHSLEAEMCLLGSMMLAPTLVGDCVDIAPPEACYVETHAAIYRAMVGLYHDHDDWSNNELYEAVRHDKALCDLGIQALLLELMDLGSGVNALNHAATVAGYYTRRQLIAAAHAIITDAEDSTDDIDEVVARAETSILNATGETIGSGDVTIFDAAEARLAQIDAGVSEHYAVQLEPIDRGIGGLLKQGLTTVIGASGHGKSTFVIHMAHAIAQEVPVVFFSFEMPATRIAETVLSQQSGVDIRTMAREGSGDMDSWARLTAAQGGLTDRLVLVDDLLDARQILARCYRYQRQGVKVVVVDYLQNLPMLPGHSSLFTSIVESAQTLQRIARKMGLCVIVVSQADKESCKQNRPLGLTDAYGGVVIQQVTDVGLSVFRPYYATGEGDPDEVQIHVPKNKFGPVSGKDGYSLRFDAPTGRFTSGGGF